MNEIICPFEKEQTRNMAISGQDAAVQVRINEGNEVCVGLPACEGPVSIEIKRNALTGLLLGKFATRLECPKLLKTIQT